MHELTATERILEVVLEHAGPDHGRRIVAVWLDRGQLSSLGEDAIRFHWELLVAGTRAEGAVLHVRTIPGVVSCRTCGHEGPVTDDLAACARCGGMDVAVVAGGTCRLQAIDVESRAEQAGARMEEGAIGTA
jgi:hydrogenase nickel incorporation protein HypA/HybF